MPPWWPVRPPATRPHPRALLLQGGSGEPIRNINNMCEGTRFYRSLVAKPPKRAEKMSWPFFCILGLTQKTNKKRVAISDSGIRGSKANILQSPFRSLLQVTWAVKQQLLDRFITYMVPVYPTGAVDLYFSIFGKVALP